MAYCGGRRRKHSRKRLEDAMKKMMGGMYSGGVHRGKRRCGGMSMPYFGGKRGQSAAFMAKIRKMRKR